MIQVTVSEEEKVDGCRVKTEIISIFFFQFSTTLIQTAIYKDAGIIVLKIMAGTGNIFCRAVKLQVHDVS
jgi:hypothetical protein